MALLALGSLWVVFFFNDTATTEIYTLSLHDALPILPTPAASPSASKRVRARSRVSRAEPSSSRRRPRRSEEHTSELQSQSISYAVFCLKKKTTGDGLSLVRA